MPELRQNFFTKEWVIIATERAKRPEELATHRVVQPIPEFVESCPFCPGNENKSRRRCCGIRRTAIRGRCGDPKQVCGLVKRSAAHAEPAAPAATD